MLAVKQFQFSGSSADNLHVRLSIRKTIEPHRFVYPGPHRSRLAPEGDFGDLAGHSSRALLPPRHLQYRRGNVEKKLFWIIFLGLSLLADVFLPFFWGMAATLPIVMVSWWLVYRSGWLC